MTSEPRDPLGRTLVQYRQERELSQGDLAALLHRHPSVISRLESGERDLKFAERKQIATQLMLPLEFVGLADPWSDAPPPEGALLELAPSIIEMSEASRASGQAVLAYGPLRALDTALTRVRWPRSEGTAIDDTHAATKLALAIVLGDFLPRRSLNQSIELASSALAITRRSADQRLRWRAHLRYGNELRKGGNPERGAVLLERALTIVPSESQRGSTLVPLARAYAATEDKARFRQTVTELRELLADPQRWTGGFNPVAVDEVELRGRLQLNMPLAFDRDGTEAGHESLVAPLPQWLVLGELTRAQHLIQDGQLDAALGCVNRVVSTAERIQLPQQLERAKDILSPHAWRRTDVREALERVSGSLEVLDRGRHALALRKD